jgi:hypothetical protein
LQREHIDQLLSQINADLRGAAVELGRVLRIVEACLRTVTVIVFMAVTVTFFVSVFVPGVVFVVVLVSVFVVVFVCHC